jgi:DNA-binding MurR/RpiR family transcriptional regulator
MPLRTKPQEPAGRLCGNAESPRALKDLEIGHMAPPPTFETFKRTVQKQYDGLSRQLRKVAQYAVDNPGAVALETVAVVAMKVGVHPSAVVRFAQAFGFDGFRALQQLCRQYLMVDKDSYRDRIRSLIAEGRDGPTVLLESFIESAAGSLQSLHAAAPPESMEQAIGVLKRAESIHLIGQRRSFSVVQYLQYALARLDCRALLADGAGGMVESQMARCGAGDAVVAVSFSPYAPQVVEMVDKVVAVGVPVVAITDSPLSPLSRSSTVSFDIVEGETAFRSLVAPMCLAQVLVVGLGQALQADRLDPAVRGR